MPLAAGPGGLRVRGSALVDAHGAPVCLRGVNWFGFNNGGTMARHLPESVAPVCGRLQSVAFEDNFPNQSCVTRRWTGCGSMAPSLQTLLQSYTGRCCSVRFGRCGACSWLGTEALVTTDEAACRLHLEHLACCNVACGAGPGFNAVRLPFSFKDLHGLPPRNFGRQTPRPTDREIAASVLPPGASLFGGNPPWVGVLSWCSPPRYSQAANILKRSFK